MYCTTGNLLVVVQSTCLKGKNDYKGQGWAKPPVMWEKMTKATCNVRKMTKATCNVGKTIQRPKVPVMWAGQGLRSVQESQ